MSKLLIVDDEVDIREFAKNYFKKRNVEVHTSASGKEALDVIARIQPDLVLLDIRMEEMSGIDVLRQLRENKNDVKVVMVTGVEEEETVQEAEKLGILGYIHKPLILEELEKVVLKELGAGKN